VQIKRRREAPFEILIDLSFDSSKTGIHTRRWTAALFCLLGKLCTDAIEGGFDTGLFTRHDFEATRHDYIW